MNIRKKMMIPTLAIALVTAIAILLTVIFIFSSYVEDTTEEEIDRAAEVMMGEYEWQLEQSVSTSFLIADDDGIRASLAKGDHDALIEDVSRMDELLDTDFINITDPEGVVLARSHDPERYGDSMAGQKSVSKALAGETYTTLETGEDILFSCGTSRPIYDDEDNFIGVVNIGYRLDDDTFVDLVRADTGAEATVFLGDTRLSTTVTDEDGNKAVGTQAAPEVSQQVLGGAEFSGTAQVVGRGAFVKYIPISNTDGEIMGMLFVGRYTDVKDAAVMRFVLQGGLVALLLLAAAVVVTMRVTQRITTPIKDMVTVADRLAAGEVDVEVRVDTKDETRELADAFERMIAGTREEARVIELIAGGDLSAEITLRSEDDVVGRALQKMLQMNNNVLGQINMAAQQVADSAGQISTGAQNLAQGSTEQAGVVEELSASMQGVAASSRENAELAGKASGLSDDIRQNAERGSEQMRQLTTAVNEINEASQAIGQVIKVIDDIAFQTNILALNAAVEAARAGEHGKGFAVVADEVRNLAGKSAEAAKDTGTMITNSIEKAELGARIAGETAESLTHIVEGINENSRMVEEIASSSSAASDAIDQVNVGIDQVAQVVQQNSATSEESAAAAEEMNSQSEMLRALVGQFRLTEQALNAAVTHAALPPAAPEAAPSFDAGDVIF